MPRGRSRTLVLVLAVAACQEYGAPSDSPSSSTLVSSDESALYAVNVDEGSVSRLDLDTNDVQTLPLGLEPTRITRSGPRLFVTLRGQREVVSLVERGNGFEIGGRVTVGAEPYGIVTSPSGSHPVYVALSLENRVIALDPETLETVASWDVPDEPRWLALATDANALFVASHRGGRLSRIDLVTNEVEPMSLPQPERGLFENDIVPTADEDFWKLDVRLTGDPCISSDGTRLAVPALYVDTMALVPDDEADILENGGDSSGYGAGGVEVGRMNPSIVVYPIYPGAEPSYGTAVFAVGDDGPGARRTPLTSTTCAGDRYVLAAMESTDTVLVVDTEPFTHERRQDMFSDLSPDGFGFALRPVTDIGTRRGPRGIALLGEQVYVHTWIDRQIAPLSWEDVQQINAFAAGDTSPGTYPVLPTLQGVELVESVLSSDEQAGRDLFTSALDRRTTSHDGGVSCSTCHVDGREDGLSWPFADGPRQTPSLAGGAADTGPFTWDGTVASIGEEAVRTSTIRMGGLGLDAIEQAQLEAWVATFRAPDTSNEDVDDTLVARGRDLFESAAVGCAGCHGAPALTDGENHLVHGTRATNTPSLRGIAATAPYLHDGQLPTLRDVLLWSRSGAMGDTSSLSDAELDALEAYLRSL